jgi:hypothetical protein
MLRRFLILAILLVLASVGGAQQPARDKAKDPQNAYEPRSEPGVGQKFLEKFVGDWHVAKTFYPAKSEPAQMQGECRQTLVQGGRFLQSEFVFERDGNKSTGTGLIGFEPRSGKFTSVWIDSRSTRMSLRQSREKFDGNEIVLYSAGLGEDGAGPPRSRTVTRLEDEGRKIVHRQYATLAEGKERLMMELVMTRKPAPAAGR